MRRSLAILLAIFQLSIALIPAAPLSAGDITWTWTAGPDGAAVRSLLTTQAGTLLTGVESGGLYRSTDGGNSWARSESGLTWPCCNYEIPSLAASATTIYAGTWGGGVYRSSDDGASWFASGAIPDEGYPIVIALAVCRFGDRLYAGGNFGVARSEDGGDSWVRIVDDLPSSWVRSLALRGPTLYALLDEGIYRLSDGSAAWVPWNDDLPATTGQRSLRATADALFLARHGGGVYHLDCRDSAWVALNDGIDWANVETVLEVDQTLYAGTMGSGAFRWNPEWWTWNPVSDGLWNGDMRVMTGRGVNAWGGTYGAGVFEFDPETETWAGRQTGMHAPLILSLVTDGLNVICGTLGGGVSRSPDLGQNWDFSNSGLGDVTVMCLGQDDTGLYAGTWNGVWKSTDHGQSWAATGLQGNGILSLNVLDSVLHAGTHDGEVWSSSDNGQTWDPVGSGLPVAGIQGLARVDTVRYAAISSWGVYALPDAETTWSAMNTGLPEPFLRCLVANQGALLVGLESSGVARWNPGTGEWEASGLDNLTVFCLTNNGLQLLAGTRGGLYASIDAGQTWADEHDGLTEWQNVRAIAAGETNLFAGLDGGGVWRGGDLMTAVEPGILTAPGVSLRVSPNPLASGASIDFTLERPTVVELSIHDVSGRLIAVLASGRLPAGPHERTWNGSDAAGRPSASGVYLIRLKAGDRELTSKAIRVK